MPPKRWSGLSQRLASGRLRFSQILNEVNLARDLDKAFRAVERVGSIVLLESFDLGGRQVRTSETFNRSLDERPAYP